MGNRESQTNWRDCSIRRKANPIGRDREETEDQPAKGQWKEEEGVMTAGNYLSTTPFYLFQKTVVIVRYNQ